MSFLASLAADILEWLIAKGYVVFAKERAQAAADQATDDKTAQEAGNLKSAKTDQEVEDADKAILSRN